ncbi:MAG: preprotein translocase subunit SecG [Acidobacteria bacterium]|nr:preprotein translocase subunit SecG [Acidobacteriota bacterium]
MYYLLITLYIISCFVLIMFVLLQPSKSDASGVFGGGGANSSAFGPRGTQTVLAKITIAAAICFFLIAFLFSIPGLFSKKSLGEGVGPASTQPAPDASMPTTLTPTDAAPPVAPAATPTTPATGNAAPKSSDKPAAKPGEAKKPEAKPTDNKKPK